MSSRLSKEDSNRLREENDQLKDLLEAACMVFSTLELNPAIDSMLKSAQELTHAPVTSIALLNEDSGDLNPYAQRGLPQKTAGAGKLVPRRGSIVEKVLKRKKILVLSQKTARRFFAKRFRSSRKIKTTACVPLMSSYEWWISDNVQERIQPA